MIIKVLIFFIILSSLISWVIWSYIFLYYLRPELNNLITNTITTNEIIKNWKTITITDLQSEITKLVKNVWPSVVNIIIKKDIDLYRKDPWGFFQEKVGSVEKQVWWGSWFFITKDGMIMTNKHVVYDANAKYTVITNDWKEYDSKVIALDPLNDLAIIKIEKPDKDFSVLNIIEDEKYINIGQFVIAIWNALWEFQNSVSFWVISWKNRSIIASWEWIWDEKLTGLLQTDAAINPWNSWWPLLNLNWEVIWMNTAIAGNWQWLWFSIPLSKKRINYILESIKKYWSIKRPFIGINYIPINDALKDELWLSVNYWAYIPKEENSIAPWSVAEKSWIQPWDIILSIDWIKIDLETPISSIIQNKIPGDKIRLEILKEYWEEKNLILELWEA